MPGSAFLRSRRSGCFGRCCCRAFHSIRSERQLTERIEFDLLFRWFFGPGVDEPVWNHSSFSKNRDLLLDGEIAARFLAAILARPRVRRLLSSEHFSVSGDPDRRMGLDEERAAARETWARRSRRPRLAAATPRRTSAARSGPRPPTSSTTDPNAALYRKGLGMEAKLANMGHARMEDRSGLFVDACVTRADAHAERVAALSMVAPFADRPRPITSGADRVYDAVDFVNELRSMNVRPHVAQNLSRRRGHSAIDRRTTRHLGYAAILRVRKRVEEGALAG